MMNERIKSLIEQCTDLVEVTNPDTDITHTREFFDKEKFAQLIVQDCIAMIENEAALYSQPTWAFELTLDIKERFGIEE